MLTYVNGNFSVNSASLAAICNLTTFSRALKICDILVPMAGKGGFSASFPSTISNAGLARPSSSVVF